MTHALPTTLAALAALCLLFVLFTLWQSIRGLLVGGSSRTLTERTRAAAERARLLREKQELLQAIRDVRFERELGKLSDGDCERLEAGYRTRARVVLEALDAQLQPHRERARELLGQAGSEASVSEASAAVAPPRPASACASCATSNDTDAVFCKKCGAKLEKPEGAS